MCEAVGHPVVRLRRVRIGPITDDHIRPGEFRELDCEEVAALKRCCDEAAGVRAERPGMRRRREKGQFAGRSYSPSSAAQKLNQAATIADRGRLSGRPRRA